MTKSSATAITECAAWTSPCGCAGKEWRRHDRWPAELTGGRKRSIQRCRDIDGQGEHTIPAKADLNDLPQSKRSLAGTRRRARIARLGQAAAERGGTRQADRRSRLQSIPEFAQRTLPQTENEGAFAVACG